MTPAPTASYDGRGRHDRPRRGPASSAAPIDGRVRLAADQPRHPRRRRPADGARARMQPLPARHRRSRSTIRLQEEYLPGPRPDDRPAAAGRRRARRRAPDRPPRARPRDAGPRGDPAGRADRAALPPGLPGPVHRLRRAPRRRRATTIPDDDIDPRLEALRGFTAGRRADSRGHFALHSAVGPTTSAPRSRHAPNASQRIAVAAMTRRSPRPHGCTQATRLACPPGRAPLAPRDRACRRSRSARTATR